MRDNEVLIRGAYDAFDRGDIEAVLAVMSPDIRLSIGGDNRLTGTYNGADGAVAFLTRIAAITGGVFGVALDRVLADDDSAVGRIVMSKHGSARGRGRMPPPSWFR